MTTQTLPSTRTDALSSTVAALREVVAGDEAMATSYLSELSDAEIAAIVPALTRTLGLLVGVESMRKRPVNPRQHCTSTECKFSQSHTAEWCGKPQSGRCACAYCYLGGAS